ncbi:lipid II flippase family protein [Proteus mirabilis]|uniref:lipid II flippase family protein n=1 Tax=Proteus mirabilis TaxID=584 RepID=UPI00073B291D|nr:DUF2837 family protein [Proteus mirabilis]NAC32653.1 DUF2837 family protein [Escherichia coli]ELZ9636548.1 DUF2837 family protein [Proteus mirabilis]KSX98896.1 hypothetical protein APT96_05955 [Proteus mirabilis]MBS3852551.1 DUF2837 family protein [Proteus mirabilis]MDC9749384.1 DUF2837 family protein [Proteus mirabilis]
MNILYDYWCLFVIPFLYGMMLFIEFISQYSRVAGYFIDKNSIAYSLQNTTFTLTRFFSVLLMPLIGFMVDKNYQPSIFLLCVITSFYFVFILGLIVFFCRKKICFFYINFIKKYINGYGLITSFFRSFKLNKNYNISELNNYKIDIKYFVISVFIYAIHALGVFVTFYFALISPDNKIMITQTSGIINAFATLLLTFKIDPALSVAIEKRTNFISSFMSIFYARLFVFFFIAPLTFFIIYRITQ